MKLYFLAVLVGLMTLACASQVPVTGTSVAESRGGKVVSVEVLSSQAQVLYEQSLKDGRSKEEAVQNVAQFLRAQPNVKDVRVTGSDSVRVFLKDGNDLLLMLGRNRL